MAANPFDQFDASPNPFDQFDHPAPDNNVGIGQSLKRGLVGGTAGLARGASLLAGAVPVLADKAASLVSGKDVTGAEDAYFKNVTDRAGAVEKNQELQPGETQSTAGKVAQTIAGLAPGVAAAALTGGAAEIPAGAGIGARALQAIAGGLPFGVAGGGERAADVLQAGGSTADAEKAAASAAIGQTALAGLPLGAGAKLAERLGAQGASKLAIKAGTGAAIQNVAGPVERTFENAGTPDGQQQPIFDPISDTAAGALFGAVGHGAKREEAPEPVPDAPTGPQGALPSPAIVPVAGEAVPETADASQLYAQRYAEEQRRQAAMDAAIGPRALNKPALVPGNTIEGEIVPSEAEQNAAQLYANRQAEEQRRQGAMQIANGKALPAPSEPDSPVFAAGPDGVVSPTAATEQANAAAARAQANVEIGLTPDIQRAQSAAALQDAAAQPDAGPLTRTVGSNLDKTALALPAPSLPLSRAAADATAARLSASGINADVVPHSAVPGRFAVAQRPPESPDTVTRADGQPFANTLAASAHRASMPDRDQFDIAPTDGGFVLARKEAVDGSAKGSASGGGDASGRGPDLETGQPTPAGNASDNADRTTASARGPVPVGAPDLKPNDSLTASADRRVDPAARVRVADMSPDDMRQALLTDHLTGIGNRRALEEAPAPKAHVAIDADGLKWVNDNLGHESGDHVLKAIGSALKQVTDRAYHVSGDEFVVHANSHEEAAAVMQRAHDLLAQATIHGVDSADKPITLKGVGISHGIGDDPHEAERKLQTNKSDRETAGLRSARGERPPSAFEGGGNRQDNRRGAAESAEPKVEPHQVGDVPIQQIPLKNLTLSKDVPQFKGGADQKGVVEPLAGKFDSTGVGPIQIWQRKDGRMEVISGRHRFDLAQRTSGKTHVAAQVHREADGFTRDNAAHLDAELNIRDGQGSVADYAQHFKQSGLDEAAANERGLLARSKGKIGFAISRDASEPLLAAHRAGQLSDEAAHQIAQTAPGDERLQSLGMKLVRDGKPIGLAANTMRAVRLSLGDRAFEGAQSDIFGFDDSALNEAVEVGKRAAAAQRDVKEQIAAVQGAAKRPEQARKLGVDVKDPEGVQKRIDALRAEAARLENWPTHPDLVERFGAKVAPPKVEPEEKPDEREPQDDRTAALFESEPPAYGDVAKQTESPAFKAWFAKSKVVDAAGKPLRVFHGTNQNIDAFSAKRLGANTGSVSSKAFFFTEHPREASEYAEMSARKQVSNSFEREANAKKLTKAMDQALRRNDHDLYERLNLKLEESEREAMSGEERGANIVPAYLKIENPFIVDMKGKADLVALAKLMKQAKASGHDGLRLDDTYDPVSERAENFTTTQWVAFDPKQIKSAVGNRGTFDSAKASIVNEAEPDRFSLTSESDAERQAREQKQREAASAETKRQADEAARAKADTEAKDFRLSGSNASADIAASRGQASLFEPTAYTYGDERNASQISPQTERGSAITEPRPDVGGRRDPVSRQLDIFSISAADARSTVAAAKADEPRFWKRVAPVKTGSFRSGIDRVVTAEEAAHVLAPLRREAQESLVALVTDKNGKPLTVIRNTVGTRNSAMVDMPMLLGAIHRVPDAASVWLAHNHPSGEARQSHEDFNITKLFTSALKGTGIDPKGMIVVSPGGKATFNDAYGYKHEGDQIRPTPAPRNLDIPVTGRRFTAANSKLPQLEGPDAAVRFIKSMPEPSGVLLLDNQHKPVAWLPMDVTAMRRLRTGDSATGAGKLLRVIEESNASAMIVKMPERKSVETAAGNMARFASDIGIKPMDLIEGGKSLGGIFSDSSEPYFSLKDNEPTSREAADKALPVAEAHHASVERAAKVIASAWKNAPDVHVIRSMDEAPARVRDVYEQQNSQGATGAPRGFFYKGDVYLVSGALRSPREALETMLHESLGHYGLQGFFGNRLKPLMADVARLRPDDIAAKIKQYGFDKDNPNHVARAAEEVLAEMAEKSPNLPIVQRFFSAVRNLLRPILEKLGIKMDLSDNDIIQRFLNPAKEWVKNGAKAGDNGRTRFSLFDDPFSKMFGPPSADEINRREASKRSREIADRLIPETPPKRFMQHENVDNIAEAIIQAGRGDLNGFNDVAKRNLPLPQDQGTALSGDVHIGRTENRISAILVHAYIKEEEAKSPDGDYWISVGEVGSPRFRAGLIDGKPVSEILSERFRKDPARLMRAINEDIKGQREESDASMDLFSMAQLDAAQRAADATPEGRRAKFTVVPKRDETPMFRLGREEDDLKPRATGANAYDPKNEALMRAVGRGSIGHAFALLQRVSTQVERGLKVQRDQFDKMLGTKTGKQQIRDAVHQFETGQPVSDPKLSAFFTQMKSGFDQRIDAIRATGREMGYLDNYFPHLYKDPVKAREWIQDYLGRKPLEGGKGWTKERFYATLDDARKAGLEAISENPADLMQAHLGQLDKYLAMHQIRTDLESRGLLRDDDPQALRKPPGFATVNDPSFRGKLVPEIIAKDINTTLGPSLNDSAAFRAFRKVQNGLVSSTLGLSGFHATMTTGDTIASHIGDAIQRASIGDVKGAAESLGGALISPLASPIRGKRLIAQSLGERPADAQTAALLRMLEQGGHQVFMSPTELNDSAVKLRRMIAQGEWRNGLKGAGMTAWEGAHALMENISPLIHKHLVPAQKMTAKVLGLKFELDAIADRLGKQRGDYAGIENALHPDAIRQIAGKVVNQVDDRLGQMNYRNLYMNKISRDILQAAFMSPGWQIGTVRTLGGGLGDARKLFKGGDTIQGSLDRDGLITGAQMSRLTSRAAYLVGLHTLVVGIAAGSTYAMTGNSPGTDIRNYFTIRTGRKNADGTDERLSFPSYLKDEVELLHGGNVPKNLIHMGLNKLNPVFRVLGELAENKDYFGDRVYDPDADIGTQAAQIGLHMAKSAEPFSVSGALKANEAGTSPTMIAANTFGINPAPGAMTRTPFFDYLTEHKEDHGHAALTPEQSDKKQAFYTALTAMRAGKEPDLSEFSPADRKKLHEYERTSAPAAQFKRLPIDQKLRAWDKASDEERSQYGLARLLFSGEYAKAIARMPPEEQVQIRQKIKEVRAEAAT